MVLVGSSASTMFDNIHLVKIGGNVDHQKNIIDYFNGIVSGQEDPSFMILFNVLSRSPSIYIHTRLSLPICFLSLSVSFNCCLYLIFDLCLSLGAVE